MRDCAGLEDSSDEEGSEAELVGLGDAGSCPGTEVEVSATGVDGVSLGMEGSHCLAVGTRGEDSLEFVRSRSDPVAPPGALDCAIVLDDEGRGFCSRVAESGPAVGVFGPLSPALETGVSLRMES